MNKTNLHPFLFTTMAIRLGFLVLTLLTGLLLGYAQSSDKVAGAASVEVVPDAFYVSSILTSTTIAPSTTAATTPTVAPTATPIPPPTPTPPFASGTRSTGSESGLPLFPILIGIMFTMLVLAVAVPFVRNRFKKK